MPPSESAVTAWFDEHRSFLWGLCYRITGSAADADDLVQETFVRTLQQAPAHLEEPRQWLTRVAVNAARDVLRRRKRRAYVGSWLPSPIETPMDDAPPSYEPVIDGVRTLEGRYDLIESVSLAFLQALEALTPTQRAVLLLCDVFDYSAAEVAAALDMSVSNVRTTHHRARRAMGAYEQRRVRPTAANRERTSRALCTFLDLLGKADVAGIERMLAADVHAIADGGGEFTAIRHPLVGVRDVTRLFTRLSTSRASGFRVTIITVNGFPAALFESDTPMGQRPPKLVLALTLNAEGLVDTVRVIASSRKLARIRPTSSC